MDRVNILVGIGIFMIRNFLCDLIVVLGRSLSKKIILSHSNQFPYPSSFSILAPHYFFHFLDVVERNYLCIIGASLKFQWELVKLVLPPLKVEVVDLALEEETHQLLYQIKTKSILVVTG